MSRGIAVSTCLTEKRLTLLLLLLVSEVGASPLFDDSSALEISLTGPLGSLIEDDENRTEVPFVLRANGIEHSIKVRLRGKSRTKVCSFPPLRLNFAAADTGNSVFEGQDKLKLVTHCRKRDSAQTNALQEYAAYRIFNLISPVGYKVRLLHVNYSDTDGSLAGNPLSRYGFLIESPSALADRVGGQPVSANGVTLGSLDEQHAASVYIFQYLIGNTDWSLVMAEGDDECCHNGDLFEIESHRYYVPYDFDLAGLVNARYATPDPSLRISKVTQRQYRGYCLSSDALGSALRHIKALREDILALVRELPGLTEKEAKSSVKYLDKFFVEANDEEKMLRSFERRCVGSK